MKKFKTQSWIVCLLVAFCLLFLPQFSKALTSQQIPLFTFSLSGGKGETLSGVAVNLDSTNAQAAITNGSITSLSLYKDDGSGQLNASLNNFIGSQSTVSIASTVTIPLSTTTEALGKFYLTMTTNGTWNGINPADSITVSTSLGKPFTISLGGNRPPVAVPTPTPTRTPTVSLLCQQSLETLQATNQTNQNIYNNAAENAQNTYGLAIIKAGTDYSQAAAQALDKKTESYANAALKFTQAQAEINNSLIIAKDAQIQANQEAQTAFTLALASAQNLEGEKKLAALKKANQDLEKKLNKAQETLNKSQKTAIINSAKADAQLSKDQTTADKNYTKALKAAARLQTLAKAKALRTLNAALKKAKTTLDRANQQALKTYKKTSCKI